MHCLWRLNNKISYQGECMFYSFATQNCVMKVNPMVIDDFIKPLDLLDENGDLDQVQTMSRAVIDSINAMETKDFGFTPEFKAAMLEQFEKLVDGEPYAIVNSYLTPDDPESKFWWEYLKQVHLGADKDKAKDLANVAYKAAHKKLAEAREK